MTVNKKVKAGSTELIRIRGELGWTQQEMAMGMGIDRSYLSLLESKKRPVSTIILERAYTLEDHAARIGKDEILRRATEEKALTRRVTSHGVQPPGGTESKLESLLRLIGEDDLRRVGLHFQQSIQRKDIGDIERLVYGIVTDGIICELSRRGRMRHMAGPSAIDIATLAPNS